MFRRLLPEWWSRVQRAEVSVASFGDLDALIREEGPDDPDWYNPDAAYQRTPGLFWEEDILRGLVRTALMTPVSNIDIASGWPLSESGRVAVLSESSGSVGLGSTTKGCGGTGEEELLEFMIREQVLLPAQRWSTELELTTEEYLQWYALAEEKQYIILAELNRETFLFWPSSDYSNSCSAPFLAVSVGQGGLRIEKRHETYARGEDADLPASIANHNMSRTAICPKMLLQGIPADYYFWWASRLLAYHDVTGRNVYKEYAMLAARTALASVVYAGGTLVHEFLHDRRLCGLWRPDVDTSKGHCVNDGIMNLQMASFRQQAIARYGLPWAWGAGALPFHEAEDQDDSDLTEYVQRRWAGRDGEWEEFTWTKSRDTALQSFIYSDYEVGSGGVLEYEIDPECASGTMPMSDRIYL